MICPSNPLRRTTPHAMGPKPCSRPTPEPRPERFPKPSRAQPMPKPRLDPTLTFTKKTKFASPLEFTKELRSQPLRNCSSGDRALSAIRTKRRYPSALPKRKRTKFRETDHETLKVFFWGHRVFILCNVTITISYPIRSRGHPVDL